MIARNLGGLFIDFSNGIRSWSIMSQAGKPLKLFSVRLLSSKSPFRVNHKVAQEKNETLPRWRRWGKYVQTNEFKRSMTVYYLCGFGIMSIAFYYYMRDRYYEDRQLDHIKKKYGEDPSNLSEYEYLKLKAFSSDKLRPREEKKFKLYQMMRKEFRRKNILSVDVMFEPTPQDLEEWYNKQAKKVVRKASVGNSDVESDKSSFSTNETNPNIVEPEDTTEFFDEIAKNYDDTIKWEERGIMLGKRRKWLVNQLKGDVLEIASGTGRNIPYMNLDRIKSITFLDSSENMIRFAQKKFRERFPKSYIANFVVGKAEELSDLAGSDVKYDTIIEAFGLCAHENPVRALKEMSKLLRPGGRIVLLEHGRSYYDFINNHLDFRSEKRMKTWACRWNLDIGELIDNAGLDITFEKRVHLGTTWLLICKRPEDPLDLEEKPFYNKLFGKEVEPIKTK